MKSEKNLLNKTLIALLICSVIVLSGCVGTVTPTQVVSNGASYDNGVRNSGFIGFATNYPVVNNTATPNFYGVVTPNLRERYNNLLDKYGDKITSHPKKDFGLSLQDDGNYSMSFQAMSYFSSMNRWNKANVSPK